MNTPHIPVGGFENSVTDRPRAKALSDAVFAIARDTGGHTIDRHSTQ